VKKRAAGRRRNEVPSLKLELIIRIPQPITDPRVKKALAWIEKKRELRNAAPAVWELLVAALNGELGEGAALAGESADDEQMQEQEQAAEDLLANFVID